MSIYIYIRHAYVQMALKLSRSPHLGIQPPKLNIHLRKCQNSPAFRAEGDVEANAVGGTVANRRTTF